MTAFLLAQVQLGWSQSLIAIATPPSLHVDSSVN